MAGKILGQDKFLAIVGLFKNTHGGYHSYHAVARRRNKRYLLQKAMTRLLHYHHGLLRPGGDIVGTTRSRQIDIIRHPMGIDVAEFINLSPSQNTDTPVCSAAGEYPQGVERVCKHLAGGKITEVKNERLCR